MLLLDYRDGSKEFEQPLKRLGLPVDVTTLEFGDVQFEGRGEGGKPVLIGIELKSLSECVGSLHTERLQGHQLLGMRDIFDFSWLLVYGPIVTDRYGYLMEKRRKGWKRMPGGMTFAELQKRALGLHLRGGLMPVFWESRELAAQWLQATYRAWTEVGWDDHTSHLGLYVAPVPAHVSQQRVMLSTMPGIGLKASAAVEKAIKRDYHGSLEDALAAPATWWANIVVTEKHGRTRRFGETPAAKLKAFLKGR